MQLCGLIQLEGENQEESVAWEKKCNAKPNQYIAIKCAI